VGALQGLITPTVGGPIRGSPDLRLHAPPRGLSQLATPFLGAQAEPSTRRRRRVGSTRVRCLFDVGPMRGVHCESDFFTLTFTLPPINLALRGCMFWEVCAKSCLYLSRYKLSASSYISLVGIVM